MAEDKKSFILYSDYQELFEELEDVDAGQLIKHIFKYVNDENPETNNAFVKLSFIPIKKQMKRDLKNWNESKENKSKGAKEGNLKRWHLPLYNKYKKGLITFEEAIKLSHSDSKQSHSDSRQSEPITEITVNDNVNVNVNVIDINKKSIYEKWIKYRNEIKKPIKIISTLNTLINRINSEPLKKVEWVIDNSIENGYQGLFWDNYKGYSKESKEIKPPSFKKGVKLMTQEEYLKSIKK